MAKHKRKRFLSILVTAVLVFTLALSSVMAQDDDHVRTDKLSVGGESVEVIEGVTGEDDANVVADDVITADDAETEEPDADEAAETEEEIPAGEGTEEADADVPEAAEDDAEADAGIMTLSAEDNGDEDDYGIQMLAAGDVLLLNASGTQVGTYETVSAAIAAAGTNYTVRLNADVTETVSMSSGTVTLDLNGKTLTAASGNSPTTLSMTGGTLTIKDSSGNNAGTITGGHATDGGGVELSGGAVVNFESGTISGNTASSTSRAGAGVNFAGAGTFNMSGGVISDNTATGTNGSGGGVCVNNGGVFNMTGGTISGNTTSNGGNGGGLYIYNGSFNMSGGTISGNTAASYGGAVNVAAGCTFTMTGGTITGNTAASGGAVAVRGTGDAGRTVFTMSGGTISNNSASTYGGAIYVDDTTVNIESNAVITGNGSLDTTTYGGGIYVTSSGILNLTGGTISGNSAKDAGGGVYCEGTATMDGGTITGNSVTGTASLSGGGVTLNNSGSTFTMNDGEISGNTADFSGGGVYVYNGTFTLEGGSISGNKVNSSGYAGAGVCLSSSDAHFVMNGGYIKDNESAGSAGGVQIFQNSSFEMNGGKITGNTAGSDAGGVQVHNGTASFTLNGGEISGNSAGTVGGGVHMTSTSSSVKFTVSGGAVKNNTSTNNGTDNVYLESGRYITLGADLSMVPATLATYRAEDQIGVTTANDSTISSTVSVQFTTPESTTDYYSTSNLYFFSDTGTASDGYPIGVRASSDGNYLELYEITPPVFETTYLMGDDKALYTSATVENYAQILAGASDWEKMSEEDKKQVNDDLTAAWLEAGNSGTLTYEDLLAQAQAIAEYADFEKEYLTGSDGQLYTEATADNYAQILAGESDWDALSDAAKAQINADLTEANGGVELTYPMLLAQAKAMDFEDNYLTGSDGQLYTEATEDNYEQILAGESDWDALSDEAKAQINADLTEANGGETLTYPMLLAQAQAFADANAFEEAYLTGSDGELYTAATADNYEQILAGASDWANMSDDAKAKVNADLTAAWQAAGNEGELTYEDLLAQAFQLKYLTDEDGNGPYTEVTADNMDQILAGADDWALMSDEAKAAVNAALTEANGGVELTYDELLARAFMQKYLTDEDGNLYTEVNADNYLKILAGEDDWNRLSPEAQALVNMYLTAAWQEKGNKGELTYPMLLEQAKAFADSLGRVKTGDDTRLYLYVILAVAAAAAAAGVAVSRRRRV